MATYTAQINQSGLVLNFVQPANGVSFEGATCNLLISDSSGNNEISYTCSIDPSNKFCYYTLQGTEFTASGPGVYNLQIEFISGSTVLFSPIVQIKILGNILNG